MQDIGYKTDTNDRRCLYILQCNQTKRDTLKRNMEWQKDEQGRE